MVVVVVVVAVWQAVFKAYDEVVLEAVKPQIEVLVNDTSHETHELSQRCAAEMIAGLIRGSKHWDYYKVCSSCSCSSSSSSSSSIHSNSHNIVYGPVIIAVHWRCKSSPGSSDECSKQRQVAADLWTKPISLSQ